MRIEACCDESRQDYVAHEALGDGHYVLIGSLWLETADRDSIKRGIKELRQRHSLPGEFKWTRVSPSRLNFYLELVDLSFAAPLRFRCIVLPADQLDAITFHGGDNELMFYKSYYLMLQTWILDFNTYRFFLDMKTNRVQRRLPGLQSALENSNHFANVEIVQALSAHEVNLLQFVDVLIGSTGSRPRCRMQQPSCAWTGTTGGACPSPIAA